MPTTIEIPNCSVAVKNTGRIGIQRQYDQKNYEFPPGKITVVPFALAHHFFGFELTPNGRLFRNTEQHYEGTTDETAYYTARANFLPWGLSLDIEANEKPYNPKAKPDKQISRKDFFDILRDTWENHIDGKLVSLPKEISEAQFAEMPA